MLNRYIWMQKITIGIMPFPRFRDGSNLMVHFCSPFPFLGIKYLDHGVTWYNPGYQDRTYWVLSIYLNLINQVIAKILIFKEIWYIFWLEEVHYENWSFKLFLIRKVVLNESLLLPTENFRLSRIVWKMILLWSSCPNLSNSIGQFNRLVCLRRMSCQDKWLGQVDGDG